VRELLQWIGTEMFRHNMHEDFWSRAALNRVRKEFASYSTHIISDVRFLDEAMEIKNAGGIIVRIVRPTLGDSKDAHISETALDKEDEKVSSFLNLGFLACPLITVPLRKASLYDYVVINNGTLDHLQYTSKKLIEAINGLEN